ncbi:MAG: tetratricopeptide repeat protein, partial [Planctomycetota bacterium]
EGVWEWVGEGAVNSDDLHYVEYDTRYSAGPACTRATFAPLLEEVWPHLRNVGPAREQAQLKNRLALHLQARRRMLAGNVRGALQLLPGDPRFEIYRRNLAEGAEWISAVADYYADDPSGLIWLATRATILPDNWDQSIALYEKALVLDPHNAVARQNLGFALAQRGRVDEAIRSYRAALRIEPDSAVTHSNLAAALAHQGELAEAAAELAEALRLDPSLAVAHRSLGIVLFRLDRPVAAVEHLSEALRLDPDDAAAREALDVVLKEIGEGSPGSPPAAVE